MRVGIQVALAVGCAIALAACGNDDSNDGPKGGSGPVSVGGGGEGEAGGGAGGGGADVGPMCVSGNSDACPTPVTQTDGVPCCTTMTDIMPFYVSRTVDHCGLKFPDRMPCFEVGAPGVKDDECPQNLDAGDGLGGLSKWGRHDGCCHPLFNVCGILQDDTGCTLFRPSALKPDMTMISGMGSGDFKCTP